MEETVQHKEVVTRPSKARAKYEIIEVMALKGFKPSDIVALTMESLGTKKDKVTIASNGKIIELTLPEAQLLGRYIENHRRFIEESGVLFCGQNGAHTVENLVKSMREHLRKYSDNTIETLGWLNNGRPIARMPLNSIEDIAALINSLKPKKTTP